jgi:DnaK suppressor protein
MARKSANSSTSDSPAKAAPKTAKPSAKVTKGPEKIAGSIKAAPKGAASTTKAAPAARSRPPGDRTAFMADQRQLLLDEKANHIHSAEVLKAEADSLALEHEPGDVQFDEEGGEGGTSNVDRELDLVLSAQARAAAVEIDRALAKIESGTYGLCEQCSQPIPDARLQALPQAALCVACKSGGLSSRR